MTTDIFNATILVFEINKVKLPKKATKKALNQAIDKIFRLPPFPVLKSPMQQLWEATHQQLAHHQKEESPPGLSLQTLIADDDITLTQDNQNVTK